MREDIADVDGGEEMFGVGLETEDDRCGRVPFVGELLHPALARGKDRHFRRGEERDEKDEKDDADEFDPERFHGTFCPGVRDAYRAWRRNSRRVFSLSVDISSLSLP